MASVAIAQNQTELRELEQSRQKVLSRSAGNSALKRGVDILGALVGLIISAPILAVFGALIYRESKGPVFYKQFRTGKDGRDFTIYKLRSMHLDAEKNGAGWTTEGDTRCLKIGGFIRRFNIDEVPQFWNVLKGDMSLVGPRPERPEHIVRLEKEIPRYHDRHAVRPGITGWAQVNGWRGDTDLGERVKCDIEYIEKAGIAWDFKIMIKTFVNRDNAY